jgi:hypothetical protein
MGGYKRVCLSFLMSFTRREPHLYSPVARLCELPQPPCLPPRACSLPAPTPTPVRSTRARTFCGHVPKRLAQRPTSAEHHSVWEGRQWPPGLVAVRFQTPVQMAVCQNICARAHPAAPTAQPTARPLAPEKIFALRTSLTPKLRRRLVALMSYRSPWVPPPSLGTSFPVGAPPSLGTHRHTVGRGQHAEARLWRTQT